MCMLQHHLQVIVSLFVNQEDNMGLEGGDDSGDRVDKVVSLHYLECWETRQTALSLPPPPQPGQGTIPITLLPPTAHTHTYTHTYDLTVLIIHKVTAFCDVDDKKISQGVYVYEESKVQNC